MPSKFSELEEDIRKVIEGCPKYYTKGDIVAKVCRKVRIKEKTVRHFLKKF